MKRYLVILFTGCLLVGCGKKDISNLPDACKVTFELWDSYINMLDNDTNVPDYFVKANREQLALGTKHILRQKTYDEQLAACTEHTRMTKILINGYKSDPQQLYKEIPQSDAAKKARANNKN